jgi:PAP2 superfamily
LNVTLNRIVARPRPNNVQIHTVAHLGLHSFPSGHVTHVIAFYGFLLYLCHTAWTRLGNTAYIEGRQASRHGLDRAQAHPAWRATLVVVQVICAYFIVFIGPSRVLEGEHWPSDVVASYLLGALVLAAVIALYHTLGVWWAERSQAHTVRPFGMGADSSRDELGTTYDARARDEADTWLTLCWTTGGTRRTRRTHRSSGDARRPIRGGGIELRRVARRGARPAGRWRRWRHVGSRRRWR